MESPFGRPAAVALRKALNELGCKVVSLAEVQDRSLVPDALLTIAADLRSVQVMYWDGSGHTDVLSAPGPAAAGLALATAEQLHAVVVALSSALMERHRRDASPLGREALARSQLFEDAPMSRAFYAMASRLTPRTNVYLRFEDF